ncbi:putative zinc protease y4wA [Nymphon striatum]|nr:putative zinc protease y4wA [Nymphon striatum]
MRKIMNRSLSPETPARISFLTVLLLSLFTLSQPAFAENKNPVHEYELDNGLRVLVKQDKRAPVAVIQVWYKVGTSYEHEGITGLSHALEHMMFKGTKKYKSGEFEKMVSAIVPYRAPVIGWMVDLEGMKLKDAKEWYKKWYTPNNATLVVVGDVEPKKVFEMAKKYFSVYASNDLPEVKARTEVAQKGMRNITLKLPAKLANLRMGFKTPGMISAKKGKVPNWEPYALEVLANILDGGDSARFAKNLVRGKEIAASAGAGYYGYGRLDNLLVITGVPAKGVETSELKKSLLDEVNILKTELVSEAELKRVKAQVIAGEVYER